MKRCCLVNPHCYFASIPLVSPARGFFITKQLFLLFINHSFSVL
jgi:hypothetical protein